MGNIKILKTNEFDEQIKAKKVVLVDFFATWCGPCKMLSPILESVKEEVGEDVEICKVDIDESMDLARKFGIMSVPTMLVFKDGELAEKMIGLRQKDQIIASIKD